GMKVSFNGGLNLSVLDGWWGEAYKQDNGWAIGHGEGYTDLTYQDDGGARAIYRLLEQEVRALFFNNRTTGRVPRGWVRMMKRSMSTICPFFNTARMVQEYTEKAYWPSAQRFGVLAADNLKKAQALASWRRNLVRGWPQVRVEAVEANGADPMHVGS